MRTTECRSCGAAIVWTETEKGARMPVDADSIKRGVVLNADKTKSAVRWVATSHFETCPNAGQHRRSNGGPVR